MPEIHDTREARRVSISIEPLDLLLFRDGRPFDAEGRARSLLPMPQTIAGALTSALLSAAEADLSAVAEAMRERGSLAQAEDLLGAAVASIGRCRFRGPFFSRAPGDLLLPLPAHLREPHEGGRIAALAPLHEPLPGWEGDGLPLWLRSAERHVRPSGLIPLTAAGRLLAGGGIDRQDVVEDSDLFKHDDRTGVAIDRPSQTALEGALFSVRFLALKPGVRLVMEVDLPEAVVPLLPAIEGCFPVGGERRLARLTEEKPIAWPEVTPSGQGSLLWCLTPAILAQGNRLTDPASLAAAVPGYLPISGWNLAAGGPKPNRFAAMGGSVFFLPDHEVPSVGGLGLADDVRLGWGSYLRGNWNYA